MVTLSVKEPANKILMITVTGLKQDNGYTISEGTSKQDVDDNSYVNQAG